MHIGIAGNIGSGKTTLTRMLSQHYGWTPKYESVTYNPYLEDYYKDIKRWSFNLEVYFLEQRFQDVLEIAKSDDVIIQDRTLFEGVYIFVANNYAMGNLSERDFKTYMALFNMLMGLVSPPDLMIYLKCSIPHLVAQIQKRGRDYEQSISIDYLKGLNDRYEKFIGEDYKGKVLTIEADDLDFEKRIISVNHSLSDRPDEEGDCRKRIETTTKTAAGMRTIPMVQEVFDAFLMEYEFQKIIGFCEEEVDGYSGFVFSTGSRTVQMAGAVNRALHSIINDANKLEERLAKQEHREPIMIPQISAHNLRHTFCTRLCEVEDNLKVIMSIMGHHDIRTTMEIYAEVQKEKKQEVLSNLQGKLIIR